MIQSVKGAEPTPLATIEAAGGLFGRYLSGPLRRGDESGTVIYPQRITFTAGRFFLEALQDGRVAVFPMTEIVAEWFPVDKEVL